MNFNFHHIHLPFILAVLLFSFSQGEGDNSQLKLHGEGWLQFGRIMAVSDTVDAAFNYSDNWIQNMGTHFTVKASIGENWDGALGLGGAQSYTAQGIVADVRNTKPIWDLFITQANMKYYYGEKENSPFSMQFGYFSHVYNKESELFGNYLVRGPVYPGFLFGEFEATDIDSSLSNTLGIQLENKLADFHHSLTLKSETQFPPIFDLSLIYTLGVNISDILNLEAGVDFYRLIPLKPNFEKEGNIFILDTSQVSHPYEFWHAYTESKLDGQGNSYLDTTFFTGRGTKVMGRWSLNVKNLLGLDFLENSQFKLYSEMAILGIANQKPVYIKMSERIPVMAGVQLPGFGWLDELVLEVEWYGAKFKNDYYNLSNQFSPVPVSNTDYNRSANASGMYSGDTTLVFDDPIDVHNLTADDIKWALYLSKNVAQGIRFSAQIANDHFRPDGNNPKANRYGTAFSKINDYYLMFRFGYFF